MSEATTTVAKRAKKKVTAKAKNASQSKANQEVTKPKPQSKNDEKTRQQKLDALIVKLRAAKFSHEKKRIRRAMRSLGHKGGLKSIDTK